MPVSRMLETGMSEELPFDEWNYAKRWSNNLAIKKLTEKSAA